MGTLHILLLVASIGVQGAVVGQTTVKPKVPVQHIAVSNTQNVFGTNVVGPQKPQNVAQKVPQSIPGGPTVPGRLMTTISAWVSQHFSGVTSMPVRPTAPRVSMPQGSSPSMPVRPTVPGVSRPQGSSPNMPVRPTAPRVSMPQGSSPSMPVRPTVPGVSRPQGSSPNMPVRPTVPGVSRPQGSSPSMPVRPTVPGVSRPQGSSPNMPVRPTVPRVSMPQGSSPSMPVRPTVPGVSRPQGSSPNMSVRPTAPRVSMPQGSSSSMPARPTVPGVSRPQGSSPNMPVRPTAPRVSMPQGSSPSMPVRSTVPGVSRPQGSSPNMPVRPTVPRVSMPQGSSPSMPVRPTVPGVSRPQGSSPNMSVRPTAPRVSMPQGSSPIMPVRSTVPGVSRPQGSSPNMPVRPTVPRVSMPQGSSPSMPVRPTVPGVSRPQGSSPNMPVRPTVPRVSMPQGSSPSMPVRPTVPGVSRPQGSSPNMPVRPTVPRVSMPQGSSPSMPVRSTVPGVSRPQGSSPNMPVRPTAPRVSMPQGSSPSIPVRPTVPGVSRPQGSSPNMPVRPTAPRVSMPQGSSPNMPVRPTAPRVSMPQSSSPSMPVRPTVPGVSRPQGSSPNMPVRPTAPRVSMPQGSSPSMPVRPTVPGVSRPQGSSPNMPVRPTLPSQPRPTASLPPRVRVRYDCPSECPICRSLSSKTCMAFDEFGSVKNDFRIRLTIRLQEALNETETMQGVWHVRDRYSASCDGFNRYLTLWADLDSQTKDNIRNYFDNAQSVTVQDMKKFPKSIFAILDPILERQLYRNMSREQKSWVCSDPDGDSCITKQSIAKQIHCSQFRIKYECPTECNYCGALKNSATCMAFDEFGHVKSEAVNRLSSQLKAAYDYTSNMAAWKSKGQLATCDGFKTYLRLWAGLKQSTKDKIESYFRDATSVTPQEMEEFPKSIFAILNDDLERQLYKNMTDEQNKWLCTDLKSESCLTRAAIMKRIDCSKALTKTGGNLDRKEAASLVDKSNITSWDDDTWNFTLRNCPDILNSKDLKSCSDSMLVANLDKMAEFCDVMPKGLRKTLVEKTTKNVKNLKTGGRLSADQQSDWLTFMEDCGGDPKYYDGILDVQDVLRNIDMSKTSKKEAMTFFEENMNSIDLSTLTKDDIVNSVKMLVINQTLLYELNDNTMEQAACEICNKSDVLQGFELRKFTSVLIDKVPTFKDPTAVDATALECASCLMSYFPKEYLDQIPSQAKRTAISSGKVDVTVESRTMGRDMLNDAKQAFNKPNGDYSADDLKKMGAMVTAFKATEIANIPDNSFNDASVIPAIEKGLKKLATPKAVVRMFIRKIVRGAGLKKALKTTLAKKIPIANLVNADITDFDDLLGDSGESDITVNRKQALVLIKKVKSALGDVSDSNTNYTLRRISNIVRYACGFSISDIKNFARDSTFLDKLAKLSESPCVSRKMVRTLYKLRKEYQGFDGKDATTLESETSSSTIINMSPEILGQFSKSELVKFGTTNLPAIASRITAIKVEYLTKKQLKEKMEFYLDAMGKTSGDLTKEDLTNAGNLICGMSSSDIRRMSNDAVDEFSSQLQLCPQSESETEELGKKILNVIGKRTGVSFTYSDITKFGPAIAELTDSQVEEIPDDSWSDLCESIVDSIKTKETSDTNREKEGYKSEVSQADKTQRRRKLKRIFKRCLKAKENINKRINRFNSGRGKRSTGSLTCSDLQVLGTTGLSALTVTQIGALESQDFIDCAELLGSVTDYEEDQKTALLDVAMKNTVWGDPSTWTTTSVYNSGVMVQAMNTAQIETLNLDLDTVSRLGQFSGWDSNKVKSVFERWLALEKSSDSSTITANELGSLGDITCGASTSHINNMSPSVYKDAADSVGEITCCEATQLQAFIALAKLSTFGNDITTYDSSTISMLGIVIGGLSASEISSLSESQINAIDANHIAFIPPTSYTGFTVTQIYTMDATQAMGTTSAQRSAVSSSQLDALSAVATTTFSEGSGAASITLNAQLMCLLLAALAFLKPAGVF